MVPGAGEFFDLANAGIYALEGNYIDAGVSLTAMIPAFGTVIVGAKIAKKVFRGGSYGRLRGVTGMEVHHMPANSINALSRSRGPSIQMDKFDHRKTSSWGSGSLAKNYRHKVKSLIDQEKMRDAMAMEVRDIRKNFGRKYNQAIFEMLDYSKRSGYIRK